MGSHPLFWKWNPDYLVKVRDGLTPWFRSPMIQWRVPQRQEKDLAIRQSMQQKLELVRKKGYLKCGPVESLTSFFAVPKEEGDIRMVYDGMKSGLNASLWAPWFPLPTMESHIRMVVPGLYMGDVEVGEMFLNFMLHERVQSFAGVDLTPFFPEELMDGLRMVLWE